MEEMDRAVLPTLTVRALIYLLTRTEEQIRCLRHRAPTPSTAPAPTRRAYCCTNKTRSSAMETHH